MIQAEVIPGIAQLSGSTATIGTGADGNDVTIPLLGSAGAQQTVVTGGSGTGKTELLLSLAAGAAVAGIPWTILKPQDIDAQKMAEHYRALTEDEADKNQLRLLLVDELSEHDDETLTSLEQVARNARTANVALVVASQDIRQGSRAGSVLQHLGDATLVQFDGNTPGTGAVNGKPFRAWWAN